MSRTRCVPRFARANSSFEQTPLTAFAAAPAWGFQAGTPSFQPARGGCSTRACWNAITLFLIGDTQRVKNTDTAERKDVDSNPLISGIKRYLGVDTNGLPHVLDVSTADITDRKGALPAVDRHQETQLEVENIRAEG